MRVWADSRALGALALVDATTGAPVTGDMAVSAPGLRLTRTRSGLWAITGLAPRSAAERVLAAHLRAFDAAPAQPGPATLAFEVTITDPAGRYLPRRVTIRLPRAADAADPADRLAASVPVALWRAPAAPVGANWAGVRAHLARADGAPLAGALVTLARAAGGAVLGRGLSDARGEVIVPVIGLPVIDFGAPLAEGEAEPAALGTATTAATLGIAAPLAAVWPPDPDAPTQPMVPVAGPLPGLGLRPGRIETATLTLTLQPGP